MRVVVRGQGMTRVPFNPCACAVEKLLNNFKDMEVEYRMRKAGNQDPREAWFFIKNFSEKVPDRLRAVDSACGANTFQFNREIEDSVVSQDFARMLDAFAGVSLHLCGTELPSGGLEIPFERLEAMAAETAKEEKEIEAPSAN